MRKRNDKYEILLQHRAKHMKRGSDKLGLVQGIMERDERSLRAAYREAYEETKIDELIGYDKFALNAKRLTFGKYNCYVVDITSIDELKGWKPQPHTKYKGEVDATTFPGGHVWIKLQDLYGMLMNDKKIKGVGLWNLCRLFLVKHWNTLLKLTLAKNN